MNLFKRYNVNSIIGEQSALSNEMLEKIDLWNEMLQGKAFWNEENKPSGIIDCTIGAIAKPVSEEIEITSKNPALEVPMQKLNESTHELVQNLVAIGGSIVRPIYTNGKMQFEIVKLGNYIPTSYDLDGTLTGCVITKKIDDGKKEFLLLEKHKYSAWNKPLENGTTKPTHRHDVEIELYLIVGQQLRKARFEECSQTNGLDASYSWDDVEKPMIVEVRNRMPNKIDGSNVPCALWQGTENLIQNADEQFARILWEQEGGELRVFADEDLFNKRQVYDADGNRIGAKNRVSSKLNKLIVQLNGNGIDAERIHDFAPNLRTQPQVEALNQILRRCELAWNIGKGTLSDLEAVVQTATQYTGGKKALYSMVDSIESELEEKYHHIAYIFAYMLTIYEQIVFDDSIEISYNDSSRKDPAQMKQIALQELQNGIISVAEYRQMFFGEDEETAIRNTPEQTVSNDFGGFRFE